MFLKCFYLCGVSVKRYKLDITQPVGSIGVQFPAEHFLKANIRQMKPKNIASQRYLEVLVQTINVLHRNCLSNLLYVTMQYFAHLVSTAKLFSP